MSTWTPTPPPLCSQRSSRRCAPTGSERFGNASSIHLDGQQAHSAVDRARATLAEFLNCHDAEVVFNSGGTEGDNTALFGLLRPGDHFVTTAIEHSAILAAAERLASFGVEVTYVAPTPSGLIDPAAIESVLRPETRLISMMLANNETGILQPVEEIGKIAKGAGAFFHIDAVQGAGKVPLDVRRFGCHLLSISAHKMHGPKGVGALFVRRGTPLEPLVVGGSHERRRRAGTENVPGIVGFAKAAELAMHSLEDGTIPRLAALRDRLEAGILQLSGTGVNGSTFPQMMGAPGPSHLGTGESTNQFVSESLSSCASAASRRTSAVHFHDDTQPRPPRGQHHQHLVRPSGGRGAGDRPRPEGHRRQRRLGLPLRRNRAQPCAAGHGPGQDPRPREPSLQPPQDRNRRRCGLCFEVIPEAVAHLRAISPVAAGTAG